VFESVNTLQKIFYFIKRLPKGAWNPANAGFFYALMSEKNVEQIFLAVKFLVEPLKLL